MNTKKIAIIGGGNMGGAIAEGLLKSGFSRPEDITITKRKVDTLQHLKEKGVHIIADNHAAVANAEVIIMALKPYNIKSVLAELAPGLDGRKQMIISIVTGIWLKELEEILGADFPVFRAMPNTAIAIQESMTCLCHKNASEEQARWVNELFFQLGISVEIDEGLMDAATVLGACGIAYALRYIRANIQGGIEIGFDSQTANLIAAQTVKGATALLIKGKKHPEAEIDKVTTPKGCTIAGLNEMEHQGFSSSLIKGITASFNKIVKG